MQTLGALGFLLGRVRCLRLESGLLLQGRRLLRGDGLGGLSSDKNRDPKVAGNLKKIVGIE